MKDRNAYYKLAGLIETDDSYFGPKRKGKRGRGAEDKSIVVAGVEINEKGIAGKAFMEIVDGISGDDIKTVAKAHIKRKSWIHSDGYKSYNILKKEGFTFDSVVVGNPENAHEYLPKVHMLFSNVEAIIKAVHKGIREKYLSNYLAEFIYKFNRRCNQDSIFSRFLSVSILNKSITLTELRA